ncbi:MAG TPA: DUF2911 domain-containing protein [Gemmatimonadales bacterium]|nr:DUF2911 domain-containing protein [Gemmatimonadales bacterium]
MIRPYLILALALGLGACTAGDQRSADSAPAAAPAGSDTAPAEAAARGPASPRDTVRGTIGSASVLVDYGRPSRRGREIFGSLVPFGQVWRSGANAATTLVLGAPVSIGGQPLDAGTYTLYSLPRADGWTLIVNGQTGQWGTEYAESRDVLRVPLDRSSVAAVDTFTISIESGDPEGRLLLAWDTLQGAVSVRAR